MTLRLTALVDYMRTQASEGNAQFAENIAQGHHLAYLNDIDYLNKYRHAITKGCCKVSRDKRLKREERIMASYDQKARKMRACFV